MAAATTRRSRSSLPRSSANRYLPPLVLLAWVVTWLGLGGALAEARLVLHIVLATGCLLGLMSNDRLLARVGVTKQWMLAGALLALSPLLSLVPLPRVLLQVTSPGRLEAWPGVTLAPSTHAPWATLAGLGSLVAVVTFAVLATLATKHGASRRQVERLVVIVSAGVMTTALAHGLAGARAAFGVLPIQADGIRYLPLVNENHLAALIVLLMPVLIGRAVTASREAERWVAGITVGLAWVLLLLIQSTAGLLLGVLVTVSTARALGLNRTTLLAGIAVTAPGISVWAVIGPRATEAHILPRLWHWLDALRLTADHWLLGAGLGTYAEAIRPYRTDTAFVRWNHAHNELVHGLAELGLVGLIATAAALWVLRPSEAPEQRDTAWRIDLGLGAVALHSLVEFPLHLPTVALTVVGLWATRLALHGSTRPAQPRLARVSLLLLCLLNVAAAGVTTRQMMVERAVTAYTPGQSSSLASWAPRHPLTALDHLDEGPEAILAIAADAPDVLIQAANLLIEDLRDDEALVLLTQARTRSPSDRRIPMLQAWIHTRSGKLSLASRAWVMPSRQVPPRRRSAWLSGPCRSAAGGSTSSLARRQRTTSLWPERSPAQSQRSPSRRSRSLCAGRQMPTHGYRRTPSICASQIATMRPEPGRHAPWPPSRTVQTSGGSMPRPCGAPTPSPPSTPPALQR